jgi:hypothetical protein
MMSAMWRAVIVGVALVLGARAAHAAPAPWVFDPPPGWTDITHDADVEPTIRSAGQPIIDAGGTFEAKAYRNDAVGTALFIVTSDMASMTTLDARDGLEAGAAKRNRQGATERAYKEDRTATTVRITQRVILRGTPVVTRRIEGFLRSGALRVISINCYGDDPTCDPLIDAVHIDDAAYRALASVQKSKSSIAFQIGTIVGGALGVLLVVGFFVRRRAA